MIDFHTFPRLYVSHTLATEEIILLSKTQTHHLHTVLRLGIGEFVRLFNGCDGEWLGHIRDKDHVIISRLLRPQPPPPPDITLIFAPIKKECCAALISTAVELGVAALHPVRTARTLGQAVAALTSDKLLAKVIGATQQSERLTLPTVSPLCDMFEKLRAWPTPLYACLEREDAPLINPTPPPCAFLVGPEGGFEDREMTFLKNLPLVRPISLGTEILRVQTAVSLCLAATKLDLFSKREYI